MLYLASVLWIAAVNAQAFDFKGVTIGEHVAPRRIEQSLGIECKPTSCQGLTTIAGVYGNVRITFDEDARIDHIAVRFAVNDFEVVREACEKKYGRPKHRDDVPLQNLGGARFTNVTLTWDASDGSSAILSRYTDATHSILLLESKARRTPPSSAPDL